MRTLILMSALQLLLLAISTSSSAENIDQTLVAEPDGEVRIEVVSGEIEVIGWDKNEIRVTGNAPNDKDQFIFEVDGDDARIEIEGKHGFWNWRSSNGSTSLKIYCPKNSSVKMEGASTEFEIENILGSVEANSMSGDINLEGGNDNIEIESVSGDVRVDGASGKLNLSSISGDVTVSANAIHFDAQTVSGNIDAKIGLVDLVDLESVSGDITVHFLLASDGRLDADTVSGDIDINFENDEINASFDIETGPGGDIKNRLSDDRRNNKNHFSGSLEIELGDGDASINIETMSGTIKLNK